MLCTLTFKNPTLTVALPHSTLISCVYNLKDTAARTPLYALLATHPCVELRELVAGREHLDRDTVTLLRKDPSSRVRRALVESTAFQGMATFSQIVQMMKDPDVEEAVARNLGAFSDNKAAKMEELCALLAKSANPTVRQSVATTYGGPKRVRQMLMKDADVGVAEEAVAADE